MITIHPRIKLDDSPLDIIVRTLPAKEHLLIIPLENVLAETAYTTIIDALRATEKKSVTSVLLYVYGEAPVVAFYRIAAAIIRCYGITKIAAIDHGVSWPGGACEGSYSPLQFPLLGFEKWSKIKDLTPTANRKYLYCSLNRIPRTDRVKFVAELIQRNIIDRGLVSCGVSGDHYDYAAAVPDVAARFPVILDSLLVDRYDATFLRVPAGTAEAVINVVGEGIVSQHHDLDDPDDRILITEKTVKAYKLHQLPLWIGPYKFVQQQREFGFDVFDDLIDHSYDLIADPAQRIVKVADELERLCSLGLDRLVEFLNTNQHRFVHNSDQTAIINRQIIQRLESGIATWNNQ